MHLKSEKKSAVSIFILWSVFFSVMISIGLGYRAHKELAAFSFYRDRFYGRQMLFRGFVQGSELLRKDYIQNGNLDFLAEEWAADNIVFDDELGSIRMKITDEDSKINLNYFARGSNTEQSLLKKIFNPELAESIIDWVDKDDTPRPFGGEQQDYYNFQNYSCRNSDIRSIYEIKHIKGFSEDVDLSALFDIATIYTDSKKVNINTAGTAVLGALGLSNELSEAILTYRDSGGVFESLPSFSARLPSPALKAEWDAYKNYFKTGSQYFKMAIVAKTTKGIKSQSIVIVKRDRESFEVIGWWENFWTE